MCSIAICGFGLLQHLTLIFTMFTFERAEPNEQTKKKLANNKQTNEQTIYALNFPKNEIKFQELESEMFRIEEAT